MEELIKEVLSKVNFSERFLEICKSYNDFDNGGSFKKQAITDILRDADFDLIYSSREKLFYKDYKYEHINLRYILPYKYGFIDCMYAFWNEDNTERVRGSFGTLSALVDPDFSSKVNHKFPIATCECELKEIIKYLLVLHNDFINKFEEKLLSNKT